MSRTVLLLSGPNRPDFVITSAYYPYLAAVEGQQGARPGPANDRTLIEASEPTTRRCSCVTRSSLTTSS